MKRKSILLGFGVAVIAIGSAFTTARNYVPKIRYYWTGGSPSIGQCTSLSVDVDCSTSPSPDCVFPNTPHGPQQLYNTDCQLPLKRQ